jgi:thiamine pyrophosphate-dependent acetolactate synthase large subunit-like protein
MKVADYVIDFLGERGIDRVFVLYGAASGRIPAFPTWNALDVITSDFENYGGRVGTYGGPGRNFGIQNSDLMLSIGSRISGRITGGNVKTFARGARKYLVDVDKPMLQRKLQQVPFDVNIPCDAKIFCERLIDRARQVQNTLPDTSAWMQQVIRWRDTYDPVRPEFMGEHGYVYEGQPYTHPYAFVRRLSEKLDPNAVVTFDLGGMSAIVGHALATIAASHRSLRIEYDVSQPSTDTSLFLDCSKAERELGWRRQIDLDDGIARTLAWWQRNIAPRAA